MNDSDELQTSQNTFSTQRFDLESDLTYLTLTQQMSTRESSHKLTISLLRKALKIWRQSSD